LDLLKSIETDVVISGEGNDLSHLKTYSNPTKHESSIKSFKMDFGGEVDGLHGNMGILIVNNMLITGFDAPVEQVMYLDKVIFGHNLLQAIARVNRVAGEAKGKGFVIDYVGIGHNLKRAIDLYDEKEQNEIIDTLVFPEEALRELEDSHAEIMAFREANGLAELADLDAYYDVFYDEALRFEYMQSFKKFTMNLNSVFPARQALEYMDDYNVYAEINTLAGKHFRDERLSMKGIPPKLLAITDKYLVSEGIHQQVKPVSILDDSFQESVNSHTRTKTKAAEIEHAIRHHLDVELNDDPDLQASFAEALAKILQEFKDNWSKVYEELEKLRQRIINASKEPTYGLSRKKQMPFFRCYKREMFGEIELNEDEISLLVDLTKQVFSVIELELKFIGFWESIPARNKLRAEIQKTLLGSTYAALPHIVEKKDSIISRTMEIAEKNNDIILYAE